MKTLNAALIALSLNLVAATPALAGKNTAIIDSCKAAAPQELGLSEDAQIRFKGITGSGRVKKVLMRISGESDTAYNVRCTVKVKTGEVKKIARV